MNHQLAFYSMPTSVVTLGMQHWRGPYNPLSFLLTCTGGRHRSTPNRLCDFRKEVLWRHYQRSTWGWRWDSGLGVGDLVTQDGQQRPLWPCHQLWAELRPSKPWIQADLYGCILCSFYPVRKEHFPKNRKTSVSVGWSGGLKSGRNWVLSGKGTWPSNLCKDVVHVLWSLSCVYTIGDIWYSFDWGVIDVQLPIVFRCDSFQATVIYYFYALENDPHDNTSHVWSHKLITSSSLCCTLLPVT